jgi:vancomycin resistance protein YoaR
VIGIAVGAVVILLAAATTGLGFYVNSLETVFPNVMVGGVDLEGLTAQEAAQALVDAGYEDNADNVAVTVNFPDGEKMTITGEDSGVKLLSGSAAEIAAAYGKDGSFFSNTVSFIGCLFAKNEVGRSDAAYINEEYVLGIINEYVQAFNLKIMKDAYTIEADQIKITKGNSGTLAKPAAVYELVVSALSKSIADNAPVAAEYNVGTGGGTDIDLQSIYDAVFKEPVSAIYDTEKKEITQSVVGVSFDLKAAKAALDAAQTGATVTIPLILTPPEVTTETLQSELFADVLADRKTYVSGTSNRVHNVMLSAQAVNGTILNPGEVFSYNKALGERTTEKGYKSAGAYVSGKVVQEIGGGICQLSSMLYCTALYADLEIVERANHMFIVTYLPLGIDATVNWGTVDFKFKNTTEYPIKIEAYMEKGYLYVNLYGTKTSTDRIEVEYVVISTKDFKTVYKEDPSIAPGSQKEESSGHTGYVVDTYKYVYDAAGTLLSKTFIARSNYRSENKVILVPVGTLEPSPSPSPSASASAPSESPPASPSPSETLPATPDPSDSPSAETPAASETPMPEL